MTNFKIGIIGCGTISDIYLKNLRALLRGLDIVAVADIDPTKAEAKAAAYSINRVETPDELMSDPEVDIVLNLTVPLAHAEVSARALRAGKHVYSEKPLAVDLGEGRALVSLAQSKGLHIGCAPDTFLGSGIQTCIALVDDGAIGDIVAASAFVANHGPESWHPNPAFFYKRGGGPLLDIGPYYFTTLVSLLGPARAVVAMSRASFPERTIGEGQDKGKQIKVEVPTHVVGAVEFESGAIADCTISFDVWHSERPRMELYGSKGSIIVPDPNFFCGPVMLRLAGDASWRTIACTSPLGENARGLGLAEMASAIAEKRHCRVSGLLALHVLEIMDGFRTSADRGERVTIEAGCARPNILTNKEINGLLR